MTVHEAAGLGHLKSILAHHVWATLNLVDACAKLTPAQLELTAPGTYGSIRLTLDHLVRADARYQARLLAKPPMRPEPASSLAVLRKEMEVQGEQWRDFAGRVADLRAHIPAEGGADPYPEIKEAVGLLLVQATHHGNDHRTHVCTVLGAHGLAAPELSGWEYFRLVAEGKVASW